MAALPFRRRHRYTSMKSRAFSAVASAPAQSKHPSSQECRLLAATFRRRAVTGCRHIAEMPAHEAL